MRLNSLIGFARKSGKLTVGRKATLKALSKGKVALLILACDAGFSLKREIVNRASEKGIRVISGTSKGELGRAVGRETCSVLGLTDWRMAKGVIELEQNKGLRAGKDNGPFKQGAYGQDEGLGNRGKNSHEYHR